MRITCPGCGSAYEVPDRAVPDPGRDVQCAGCGSSWFLLKARGRPDSTPEADVAVADGSHADRDAAASPSAHTSDTEPSPAGPPRRRVDPEVLNILRTEAETERRARSRDAALRGAARQASRPENDPAAGRPAAAPPADRGDPFPSTASAQSPSAAVDGNAAPQNRLARLTAAERAGRAGDSLPTDAWAAGDGDTGLVEDPNAALRDPQPPLIGAARPDNGPGANDAPPVAVPTQTHLPVAVAASDDRALACLRRRRRGFRWGFSITVGLCGGAILAYLAVLDGAAHLPDPLADAILHHGTTARVTVIDWLQRVVIPVLS